MIFGQCLVPRPQAKETGGPDEERVDDRAQTERERHSGVVGPRAQEHDISRGHEVEDGRVRWHGHAPGAGQEHGRDDVQSQGERAQLVRIAAQDAGLDRQDEDAGREEPCRHQRGPGVELRQAEAAAKGRCELAEAAAGRPQRQREQNRREREPGQDQALIARGDRPVYQDERTATRWAKLR